MKVKSVAPLITNRNLTPLAKYKGPKLELRFYEQDEINLLKQELVRLDSEARDVIRTMDIKRNLTGHQKRNFGFKLLEIDEAIESIKKRIYDIKKARYAVQLEEYKKGIK